MNIKDIELRAEVMRQELGGKIFAFPIHEKAPFSKYALTKYIGNGTYITFPQALDIQEAAAGIQELIKGMEEDGEQVNYDRDVRFSFYDAQRNAPDARMKDLRDNEELFTYRTSKEPLLKEYEDIVRHKGTKEEDYYFTPRGIVKFSYISSVDDKLPKGIEFMNEYYKLLSTLRYGKTAFMNMLLNPSISSVSIAY